MGLFTIYNFHPISISDVCILLRKALKVNSLGTFKRTKAHFADNKMNKIRRFLNSISKVGHLKFCLNIDN